MSQKLRPLFLSLVFFLVSLGTYQIGSGVLGGAKAAVDSPAGTWRQYIIADGQPVYLGTFHFTAQDGDFTIRVVDVAPYTFPQSNFRTFGHRYDGLHWSFNSDWHEYGIAQFQLERMGPDRFEGQTYLNGHPGHHRHILVRVPDARLEL